MLRVIPRIALSAVMCALLFCGTALGCQDYPNKPIRVVIPFPPGGPTDGMARIVSERLGKLLGQTVVVDNRGGGAGGSVGAKSVAAAEPDGYSIPHDARRIVDHRAGRACQHRLRSADGFRRPSPS